MLTVHSEKARIPAWCDRVLFRGENLHQFSYNTAPLRFSDHRPVYAMFHCQVRVVDETSKEQISRELYERRRLEVGNSTASTQAGESDDEDINGYESIGLGLPPASSDGRKWWLDKGAVISTSFLLTRLTCSRASSSSDDRIAWSRLHSESTASNQSISSYHQACLAEEARRSGLARTDTHAAGFGTWHQC